jgi:hypothetical protein
MSEQSKDAAERSAHVTRGPAAEGAALHPILERKNEKGQTTGQLRVVVELRAALDAAERERDELRDSFTLRWKADMRGIKLWQEAHAGKDLTWPSHCDLVAWLLEQRDAADAAGYERGLREAAERARCVPIPDDASAEEAHGRISAALEAAMRILSLLPSHQPATDTSAFLDRILAAAQAGERVTAEDVARLRQLADWADAAPAPGWDGTLDKGEAARAVEAARKRMAGHE